MAIHSLCVNNYLPELINAGHRVLNCYRYNTRLLIKGTVSTIDYSFILLIYSLIKILLLFFLTVRWWSTYYKGNL